MSGFSRSAEYHQPAFPFLTALLLSCGFGVVLGISTLVSPLLSAALLAVFALVYHLVIHPFRVSYLVLIAIIFTSAIPRNRIFPVLKINEIILVLAMGWLLLPQKEPRRRAIILPGVPLVASAILVVGTAITPLVAYRMRGFSLSTSEILGLIAPIQYLCLFYFFALFPKNEAQRHQIIQLMWFLASIVAVIGLLQAARIGPVTAFLNRFYPSEHTIEAVEYGRLTSVFGAWNVFGAFLMSMLVMALAFQKYPRAPHYQLNLTVMVLLVLTCLLATNSYASLIGLALSVVILNLIQSHDKRLILYILLFIAVAAVILWPIISIRLADQFNSDSLVPQTIRYRFMVWEKFYIPMIQRSPLWGVSPNLDNVTFPYAESQYLYMAFHAGAISVASHLVWAALLLGWLFGIARHGPELSRNLGAATFTLLIVYSLMGITNPVFTYSGAIDIFWISLGLIVNERI
ncbi:MAG: O-antigen ligase family protein [Actinomycetia bacterium]|nr:O-antigen ligase family protein [Actinomycetes bacterium]